MSHPPYEVFGASASAYIPGEEDYADDVERLGVDPTAKHHVVALGSEPDMIFYGDREALIALFREAVERLGG